MRPLFFKLAHSFYIPKDKRFYKFKKRYEKKRFTPVKFFKRPKKKLPLICKVKNNKIFLIRGTWHNSLDRFFCLGEKLYERYCNNSGR